MIKLTEEKLQAFEVFLNQQSSQGKVAFESFTICQREFAGKAIVDILEEENCLKVITGSLRD